MNRLLIAAAALALAACATTPTVYGPAPAADAMGYREQRIETGRYRVSFRANADLKGPQVEDLALRRAAEIAQANGAAWFQVVSRFTEQVGGRAGGGTSLGLGGSTGSSGSGVGVGLGIDLSPDSRQYETTLEILLGQGAKPAGDGNVYDVASILART
jgi:hypothetical protein